MLPLSYYRVSFARAPFEATAIDAVSRNRFSDASDELPPWPLVVVLPLITGLSITLWAGIARLVSMLIAT